jgi:glycosylphosphatidylinositol transamidase (GPIT) subunit GPI8
MHAHITSHAQVLRRGGYHEDRIVVMAFDDIATDKHNPFPGKVFNRAGERRRTHVMSRAAWEEGFCTSRAFPTV